MYGAICGDIVGSPFEFDQGDKTKDFEMFSTYSCYTDDTVLTVAVAEALINMHKEASARHIKEAVKYNLINWTKKYPYIQGGGGYGVSFARWVLSKEHKPYKSFGNGSAMRVSAAGWLYKDLKRTRKVARATAAVTHKHKEGIKGAEAVASAIYLARTGCSKQEIKDYIINNFHYDLSRTCDEIRPDYKHIETCQQTVPEAITAFMEGKDFEDVIRTAVSLGGDSDTLTCIAGSIAEAFYGMPEEYKQGCRKRLKPDMLLVVDRFEEMRIERVQENNY